MDKLQELIGIENDLPRVSARMRDVAIGLSTPVVGGYHVTCSDESEWECVEAFQQLFAQPLLPALKSSRRAVFRTINLGARHEPGAIYIAEEHFATPESRETFKLMVVKMNSHVGVRETSEGVEYGWISRYECRSACCGALAAMLSESTLPAARQLHDLFSADGQDRVTMLNDPSIIALNHRALAAAVVNARLQSRAAAQEIECQAPESPTVFLILPCVTINRPGPDTEVVVGRYRIDWTDTSPETSYEGLGDDPASFRIRHDRGRLQIEDDSWPSVRTATD